MQVRSFFDPRRGPIASMGSLAVWALLAAALASCSRGSGEPVDVTRSALGGAIIISGSVTGGNGLPVAGVTVHLDGRSQGVRVTSSSGAYSFTGLGAGSYSVRATLSGCAFIPDVVNLNNLSAGASQNFSGSGPACGGPTSVNQGATTGPLRISGRVRDAAGRAVVGSKITLGGGTQAVRFSDITGSYAFHVNPGSYSLSTAGACPLAPANVNLNNLASHRTQDFVAGAGCLVGQPSQVASTGEVIHLSQGGAGLATTLVSVIQSSPTATLARLRDIAAERSEPIRTITVAGSAAIERQALIDIADPDAGDDFFGEDRAENLAQIWLTTAIAAGDTVVRFETLLPEDASAAAIDAFFTIARNFTPEATASLHGPPPVAAPPGVRTAPATPPPLPPNLTPAAIANGVGETAVAAADSANAIVYARNPGRIFVSPDGGANIAAATLNRNLRTSGFTSQGDPVLTVGAPAPGTGAQSFYYAQLFQSAAAAGGAVARTEIAVFQSTDNGNTFNQTAGLPIDCSVAAAGCTVPDQPMFAADRVTQSNQGDRLYVAWRQFVPSGSSTSGQALGGVGVACSPDGGATWSAPNTTAITATGADFPRVAVGPDGTFYVAYETGEGSSDTASPNDVTIWVQRFSACNNAAAVPTLAAVGNPAKIADGVGEVGLVPGMDRRPFTGQYQVVADDSDGTGQRVFVIYVDEVSTDGSGGGNADIRFAESRDGGATFSVNQLPINRVRTGHRYLPWTCSSNGIVYVTWYDRRDATSTSVDGTAYFYSSIGDPGNTGDAVVGQEVNASGGSTFDDAQCQSGFPVTAPRAATEETLCTGLPALPALVLAGTCQAPCPAGVTGPCGSLAGCDFRSSPTTCATGETCATGRGAPKYGDYNGAACAGGELFMAWASAVVPQGIACAPLGAGCTVAANCCNGAACTGGVCTLSGACTGNGLACATNGACCSGNCLGGTCQLGVAVYASSTAVTPPLTCAPATSTPDASFTAGFDIDTSFTPPAGGASGYGQANCPNQFLIDVDLNQPAFQGHDLFVSGSWTTTLPVTPCDEKAVMTVFVTSDGTTWQTWDTVVYAAQLQGSICNAQAQSHTNSGSLNLGGTNVPASGGFQRVRVALNATQQGNRVPVVLDGQAL